MPIVGATRAGLQDMDAKALCPKSRANFAFMLMEVLVAVACFVIVAIGLFAGLAQGVKIVGTAQETFRATQILQEQTEGIRLYTWEQITSNGFISSTFTAPFYTSGTQASGGFSYTGHISIADAPMTESYSNDHKLVTLTLSWNRAGIPHQQKMSTLVSRYGLHNYYYHYNP